MFLLDQLERVNSRWRDVRNAEKAAGQVQKFSNLAREVDELAKAVLLARAQESALGPAVSERSLEWRGVLSGLSQLEQSLASDALVDLTSLRAQCLAVVDRWKSQNLADWLAWREQHKGVELGPDVLAKLRPVAKDVVEKLQSLLRERAELSRKPHAEEGDVERIRGQGQRVAQALAEIGFDDQEVRAGFEKLVVEGVALDELSSPNSPLRAWLASKGLLSSCKVRLS